METLLKRRLETIIQEKDLIPSCQHGFTRWKNCNTNLLEFYEHVSVALDKGRCVDAVYLDFRKAFDLVPHAKLVEKLLKLGIEPAIVRCVSTWLYGQKQRGFLYGAVSPWESIQGVVVQGSVLGSC